MAVRDKCKTYAEKITDLNGYPFCEICGLSNGRFHIHHIYYRSKVPRHPELHNHRNLIMVCETCHRKLHGQELKDEFKRLEKERGLKELFEA